MWRNYWTAAVRALAKSKTYSIINIAGLAIGMAACILILLYIRYEQSYDKWLPDVENTYQLQAWYPSPDDGEPGFFQMSSYVTKDRIKKDFPQIINAAYIQDNGPVLLKDGQATSTEAYLFTDEERGNGAWLFRDSVLYFHQSALVAGHLQQVQGLLRYQLIEKRCAFTQQDG